jgi:hypothetical protein
MSRKTFFEPESIRLRLAERSEPQGDCIVWTGSRKGGNGYGQMCISYKNHMVHRLAWEVAHGPIPPGLCVLHRCDNPPCIRPDHLFLGTHQENMADMVVKQRGRYHRHAPSREV